MRCPPRSMGLVCLAFATLVLTGCRIDVPEAEVDDQVVGAITRSSDTIYPLGEVAATGEMLLVPERPWEALFAGTLAEEARAGTGMAWQEAARHVRVLTERFDAVDGRRVPIEAGTFSFGAVDPGTALLCHVTDRADNEDGVDEISGCVELELDPPLRVKLLSEHGGLRAEVLTD